MATRKKKKSKEKSLIFSSLIMSVVVILITVILSLIGFDGEQTSIVNGALETSLVTIKNIFSVKGIQYFFNNCVDNFSSFKPLFLVLISLVGIGVAEIGGLFKAICSKYRNVKFNIIIILTLLVSIISGICGEYSFALILPLVAVIYKNIGKNPLLGLLIAFFGLTIGSGASIIFTYDNYLLGQLTQEAARVEVDKNYDYNFLSTLYISLSSLVILTFVGLAIINKLLVPKFNKNYINHEETEEIIESRKGKKWSLIALFIMIVIIVYEIIPGLPLSGLLLNRSENLYIAKLFGYNSPFRNALVFILSLMLMICGYIYARVSNNIKDSKAYINGLIHIFDNFGLMFVLSFVFSQLIAIFNWTGIGKVISANLVDILSKLQLSGIPLIILFVLFTVIATILMPSLLEKWIIFSPLIVPLFMRANMAPEFTQFIFTISNGIGQSLTPLFGYFIILIALLRKYNIKNNEFDAFSSFYKLILPIILTFMLLWLLVIIGWYISGLPIGIDGLATL